MALALLAIFLGIVTNHCTFSILFGLVPVKRYFTLPVFPVARSSQYGINNGELEIVVEPNPFVNELVADDPPNFNQPSGATQKLV